MTTALTYHSDEKFKADFVSQTIWHRETDRYLAGTYSSGDGITFKGCSLGCSVNSLLRLGRNGIAYNDHAGAAKLLGWPAWLTHLQDGIFENLPAGDRPAWTEQLAQAVPVGKNIDRVKWQFCAFLCKENIDRVLTLEIEDEVKKEVVEAIRGVLVLHEKAALTGSAARSAAWSAAWFAERSAKRSAERSAARSAELSVGGSAAYQRYRDELLKLLKAA